MFKTTAFRSRILAGGLVAAFVLLTLPLPSAAQNQTTIVSRLGTLEGTVFSEGGKTRVSTAIVKIRNLNNQKEYVSLPTDVKGSYKIIDVEEGWYTLGVTTVDGDFNLNYGVYVKAGEIAKLSVEMQPGGMLEGKGGSSGGGSGRKSFFAKPGGILLIVALAGAAGFGVYELTKKETEVSPIR